MPPTLNRTPEPLTPRQLAFVERFCQLDGSAGAAEQAALYAGYGHRTEEGARRAAAALLRNPRVLSAIRAELGNRLTVHSVAAVAVLAELAMSAESEAIRLAAAKEVLARGVGPVPSRVDAKVAVTSIEEVLLSLPPLDLRTLDVTPIHAIEHNAEDAEFVEVDADDVA